MNEKIQATKQKSDLKRNDLKASNIYIEISGRCNARCPYCARQRFKQRYSGANMSPVLFKNIINHLLTNGLLDCSRASTIFLYNWGEPFLNPEINTILKILKNNNLFAVISSNFIMKPEIDIDSLKVIREVIFSLSGFTQESYGKIHGASLKKVLNNFDRFYENIRSHSPGTMIIISWHRYEFNENEFWDAYKYFNRPGIFFRPILAFLNDLQEMMAYKKGEISQKRISEVRKDMFIDQIFEELIENKSNLKKDCSMWDCLVIDEFGQLLLCCGVTNMDYPHVYGNILEIPADKIHSLKISDPLCNQCRLYGLPFASTHFKNKPLPKGGGFDHLKLWIKLNLYDIAKKIFGFIRKLPVVNEFIINRMISLLKKLFA